MTVNGSHRFQIEDERQRTMLQKFIQARPLPFQCEVGPIREQRTLPQNSRLWALHHLASQATGYAPDELHELMLSKFFGTKTIEVGGVVREVPAKRSSVRDKQEFREFLDNVENFYASTLGVWLGHDE
jgi:hypothetical protein